MLKKHEGIIIPEPDPFSNDKLNRKAIIENLTRLVTNLHQPFVISINSPWGTGKTVFIKMWEQYLKNKNFATLYFNAWENDFSSEPLISLLSEIKDQLVKGNDNDALKTTANNLLKKGRKILKYSLPVVSKVLIETIFNLYNIKDIGEDLADFASEKVEDKIKENTSTRAIQNEFRDLLTTFSNAVIDKEKKTGPIVFFIDELDRCRPDYSVKLLESIKHLFNIDKFVFVIAIDRKQIGFSIQTLYGSGMDTEGYLKRFIDLNYNLPEPSRKNYIEFLFDMYSFWEIKFSGRQRFDELFLPVFTSIADVFELSLRDIEHCFTYMSIVLRIVSFGIYEPYLYLTCFLMPLKIKELELYNNYITGRINGENLIDEITTKYEKAGKFFETFDRYNNYYNNIKYDINVGIILEYFLETVHLDDYQSQSKYEQGFPEEAPGLEKLRDRNISIKEAKKIQKKSLLRNSPIDDTIKCFKSLKTAMDFVGNFNEK